MQRSSYRERDYSFGQMMLTLRTTIGLTQTGLASQLGVSRNTVAQWEGGSSYPKTEHLQHMIELGVRALVFPAQHEEEAIQTLWRAARQKVLLDKHWLQQLHHRSSSTSPEQSAVGAPQKNLTRTDETALWTVPFPRNAHFTGRHELLDQLTVQLTSFTSSQPSTLRRAALTQAQVIKGLGGIGKTQIAVEYAYRAREMGQYTHTLWFSAASEEALLMSFAVLAEQLPSVSSSKETDQRKLFRAVIRWLEQCQDPWLLILDNADDLSMVQPYLPVQGPGSLLFTTRSSAVSWLAPSLEVSAMGVIEGAELLLRRAGRFAQASDEHMNEAATLATELALFPLALDQAGAYIEETGCSVTDYLRLYQTHRRALLSRRGRQARGYPHSVATTWELSFQHIEATNPAAADLLRLCAFLAPDAIPEELFIDGAPYWSPALQQAVADRLSFNQMLSDLLAFSLIKRFPESRLISIHRLVQVVQQERLSREEQYQWARRLLGAMNTIFPRKPEEVASWSLCQRYLEQVQACDVLIEQHQILLPEAAELLDRAGIYLHECALYTLAEPLYRQAVHIREQQGEPEGLAVAATVHGLAKLYREQGKYAKAEPLYLRALSIREQHLGPEDAQVATSLNDLAGFYRGQGKYTLAEPLLQRALCIREQQLGPEHLQTADSLNDLAVLYENQGKYSEAEPLSQQALSIREQQLGLEHPLVATSLNNLAVLYASMPGKNVEVESLHQRALRIWEQQLGEVHPMVAYPLLGLALAYREQGEYAKAEPLYLRALSIREQHLGERHAALAFPLSGLAEVYRRQGKYVEAEPLYLRALSIREQQLGQGHRHVALSLTLLANLYTQRGEYIEAEPLYVRALHIVEQQLGPKHLETAQILDHFANFRHVQGNTLAAADLYQHALTIRETVLGPDDPRANSTRQRLDTVLGALSSAQEARQEKG